jgi:hypothetical protein
MRRFLISLLLIASPLAAQNGGVMPDWEVQKTATALVKHAQVIDGLLNQLKPAEWVKQGASPLYVNQLKMTKQLNGYLAQQAQALADHPDKLSIALDVLFRLDYIHSLLQSLTEATRRHQNPSLAELLDSAINQNTTAREQLKDYTRELAIEREKEWQIANEETQRCRALLFRQPRRAVHKAAPKAEAPKATETKPAEPAAPKP